MKEESLIKDATQNESSTWRKNVEDLTKEFQVYEQMSILKKGALKKQIHEEINSKTLEDIEHEAEKKSKIKY